MLIHYEYFVFRPRSRYGCAGGGGGGSVNLCLVGFAKMLIHYEYFVFRPRSRYGCAGGGGGGEFCRP